MYTLVVNGGSSSIKYAIFDQEKCLGRLSVEIASGEWRMENNMKESPSPQKGHPKHRVNYEAREDNLHNKHCHPERDSGSHDNYSSPLRTIEHLLNLLSQNYNIQSNQISQVGYRVVHGGSHYHKPTLITDDVLQDIDALSEIAPLHNPIAVKLITAWRNYLKDAKHIAIFDTAFHHTIPEYAYTYALPLKYRDDYHIRRYGFHGISCASILRQLKNHYTILPPRIIIVHLGSGCSMTAIQNGQSIDTTMGFSPLEGLVMATRPGDVDASALLYLEELLAKKHPTAHVNKIANQLSHILNKESGLKGIAGVEDMREVLKETAKGNHNAELAIEVFVHRIKKYIGAFYATLGGCDTLVFTGAIGVGSQEIRKRALEGLEHMGMPNVECRIGNEKQEHQPLQKCHPEHRVNCVARVDGLHNKNCHPERDSGSTHDSKNVDIIVMDPQEEEEMWREMQEAG